MSGEEAFAKTFVDRLENSFAEYMKRNQCMATDPLMRGVFKHTECGGLTLVKPEPFKFNPKLFRTQYEKAWADKFQKLSV